MRLLDIYLLKNFIAPFCYALLVFVLISIIFGLRSEAFDFSTSNAEIISVEKLLIIHLSRVILLVLPIALMTACIYSLGQMSQFNEFFPMVSAGQSLPRILLPIYLIALLATCLCILLSSVSNSYNYADIFHGSKAFSSDQESIYSLSHPNDPTTAKVHRITQYNDNHTVSQSTSSSIYQAFRWATPWRCIAVTFFAATIGIFHKRLIFNRIIYAAFLYALMPGFDMILFKLSYEDLLPAWAAAWFLNVVFSVIGLLLLRWRTAHMD